jgi:hypothetical protein
MNISKLKYFSEVKSVEGMRKIWNLIRHAQNTKPFHRSPALYF